MSFSSLPKFEIPAYDPRTATRPQTTHAVVRLLQGIRRTEENTRMAHRDNRGRRVAAQDDFLEIRDESAFIEILRSATIITNDVRKILDEKLGFRNTCAHPNDIVIPESKVLAAIEDLVYNVVLKYPL
jgi:hypothetical protein